MGSPVARQTARCHTLGLVRPVRLDSVYLRSTRASLFPRLDVDRPGGVIGRCLGPNSTFCNMAGA